MRREIDPAERPALLGRLSIKDSDIRIATLEQGFSAVDRGIHMGGAFSAVVPMVSLYYGGFMDLDIDDPTRIGQDIFVLSKGHAVATLASIYADLGYFPPEVLINSRSLESILNGHPGPTLPGVLVATGPLGQGLAVAQGFAMAARSTADEFEVFCITGDGELQQGIVWEVFMHAPKMGLHNLCVLVDKNEGQLDDSTRLVFPMDELPNQIESFGWRVLVADGTSYDSVIGALEDRARSPRDGRPAAIICNTAKGYGAFDRSITEHKITLMQDVFEEEHRLQSERRDERVRVFTEQFGGTEERSTGGPRRTRSGKVPTRDKRINYDPARLPSYAAGRQVTAGAVVTATMAVFAEDPRVVSVDADLSSTSGLFAGIAPVDPSRAHNVGIAESNMMCIGEAYAALGYNAWVSTFCPFFDWKVMRRIAVGMQEREESKANPEGWLSNGHGLDLTFLATAPNLETQVNGATHMGNDDVTVFAGIAGLKIIDVSCPNQLVSIMRWIMNGNRGLIYLRIMRRASGVLHEPGTAFEYGRAVRLRGEANAAVNLVSSGRGVHEICAAASLLEADSVSAAVYDMPSFDPETMTALLESDAVTVIAEQNNGFLWNALGRLLLRDRHGIDLDRLVAINTCRENGSYQFIHSATYEQLLKRLGLSSEQIAQRAAAACRNRY